MVDGGFAGALNTVRLRPVLEASARYVDLPSWFPNGKFYTGSVWLEALILQESNGEARATRYEGHLDRAPDGDSANFDDRLFEDDASFGLCQVMGFNARILCGVPSGTRMNFSFLLLPLTNITFGLRILLGNLGEAGRDVSTALARYNGGHVGNPVGGPFRTQAYVDGVARHADRVVRSRAAQ